MPLRRIFSVVFVLALCAGVHAQQQFTVVATILDPEKGTPVETLAPGDVHVMEDGVDGKIVKVEPVNHTVKVQVLIDNGVGIGQNLAELRNGVRGLLEALPRDVETTLVTTSPQGRILVRPTKDREALLKGVSLLTLDSATGRFTESLTEAAERGNKDKDAFTIIIAAATTSGDRDIREVHTKRLLEQIQGKPMVIHVVLYSGEKSATFGDTVFEVAQRVTKITGGRYEAINNMTRYETLLPELAADVAKQATGSVRQFRITVQRPGGKSGNLGKLGINAGARVVSSVKLE